MKSLVVIVGTIVVIILFGVLLASAEEPKIKKLDNYSARITISNVNEKEGVKTTVSQEKTFTLEELTKARAMSEGALKSWQDESVKCNENIALQTNQVALWDKLIVDTKAAGIIEKPTLEKPIEAIAP